MRYIVRSPSDAYQRSSMPSKPAPLPRDREWIAGRLSKRFPGRLHGIRSAQQHQGGTQGSHYTDRMRHVEAYRRVDELCARDRTSINAACARAYDEFDIISFNVAISTFKRQYKFYREHRATEKLADALLDEDIEAAIDAVQLMSEPQRQKLFKL